MTNILLLLSHTEKGGGEVVIYNLIKNLDRTQFRPFLGHVDFRKGTFIHEFRKLGVEPVDFHASHLRNFPVTLAVVLRLARFIRNNAIDVIFTSGAHNHIYAALAKKINRVPIVTYVMNYYKDRLKDNPLIVRVALGLGTDYYLACSFSCLEPINKIVPTTIPRGVIYHGVDKDFIQGQTAAHLIRKSLGLQDSDKLISIISRLQRWKGQDVFVRAASLIVKAYPQAYFCAVGGALFGMEQDYTDELRHLIDGLGLKKRCWLVGYQYNVQDWISVSDVIVHASRSPEPGALSVMEAMSLGKPVVATSCGAPAELIEDGRTGILCKPDSPEDLAYKIMKLLDDGNLANKIGKAARDIALERFSAKRMTQEIEDVLGQVVPETAKKKCVLFTMCIRKKGGQEVAMRNAMKVIDSKIFKPIAAFLYLGERGTLPDELQKLGVEVVARHVGRLRNPVNVLRTVYWLAGLIKEKNVKLIFSASGTVHPYSRIAALVTRIPIIAYETFIFKKYFWQDGPICALNFLLSSNAYLSSGKLAAQTLHQASLWKKPIHYLPNMVDLDIFDYHKSGAHLRERLNIPADAFVFSMVARIQKGKGQNTFIEAAMRVLKEAPATYFLIFGEPTFGEDEIYLDSLNKKVEYSGFSGQIIFAGYLEEPVYAYAASNVICHCPESPEAFGMVAIESFAMKRPVIGTINGGIPEIIEDGIDGWLVPSGNAEELTLAMKRSLKERDCLAKMGEYGFQKAREIYNQQQFASGINSIISKYIRR